MCTQKMQMDTDKPAFVDLLLINERMNQTMNEWISGTELLLLFGYDYEILK